MSGEVHWNRIEAGEYAVIENGVTVARAFANGSRVGAWTWAVGSRRGASYSCAAAKDEAERQLSAEPCPYTVGKRVCVAGAKGHAGPHDWPKVARK